MNIRPNQGYTTSDGKQFSTASEAAAHEFTAHLRDLFHGLEAYGIIKMMADAPEMVRDALNEYLEMLEEHPDLSEEVE